MDNKFKGEVTLLIDGEEHIICFDWTALSILKSTFSENDLDKIIAGNDLTKLADVLVIGLKKHHPDINVVSLMEKSPPLVKALEAVEHALTYAYFGEDGPPANDQDSSSPNEKKSKKKNTKRR